MDFEIQSVARRPAVVSHHRKGNHGWAHVKTAPADCSSWDKHDRGWIADLLEHGTGVLTIGDSMYELKRSMTCN